MVQKSLNRRPKPGIGSLISQGVPDDRLMGAQAVDAKLRLENVEGVGGRPVGRGKQQRIGLRMFAHQFASHLKRRVLRDRTDAIERTAPAGAPEHLAIEQLFVAATDAVRIGRRIGMGQHRFAHLELSAGGGLRRCAGRHLDSKLGFERDDHLPGVLIAVMDIDRHATKADEINACRLHLPRGAQADLIRIIELLPGAHRDGETGDDERNAARHDLVEFIRKDFRRQGRRGVADARAIAIGPLVEFTRHSVSSVLRILHVRRESGKRRGTRQAGGEGWQSCSATTKIAATAGIGGREEKG